MFGNTVIKVIKFQKRKPMARQVRLDWYCPARHLIYAVIGMMSFMPLQDMNLTIDSFFQNLLLESHFII